MARILLVDDNQGVRGAFSMFLQDSGYKVETASDGDEAFELLQTTAFDIVITDFEMSWMNGDELCRKAKEILPLLPIVMFTGTINIPNCGADVTVPKGQGLGTLLAIIQRLLIKK